MRESIVKTCRDFYKKDFESSDVRNSIIAIMSVKINDPLFNSQTKTKLESEYMVPGGQTVRNYVNEMVSKLLDNYLHRNPDVAEALLKRIQESEKERIEITNIKKQSKEIQKKVSLPHRRAGESRGVTLQRNILHILRYAVCVIKENCVSLQPL